MTATSKELMGACIVFWSLQLLPEGMASQSASLPPACSLPIFQRIDSIVYSASSRVVVSTKQPYARKWNGVGERWRVRGEGC